VRKALLLAVAVAFAASGASAAGAPAVKGRLQGTFTMQGRITTAVNVYGEHTGQRVTRKWIFNPQCPKGSCLRVTLVRQRSGQNILNKLVLQRTAPGVYVGHGHFWVALKCAGQVIAHGGRASETITVRITRTAPVGASNYATRIQATYNNPSRVNLTRCPGGIGHDAARYHGKLTSPLPTKP
jgi:hypothetical protein